MKVIGADKKKAKDYSSQTGITKRPGAKRVSASLAPRHHQKTLDKSNRNAHYSFHHDSSRDTGVEFTRRVPTDGSEHYLDSDHY